jgi:uncharacterized protein (DUF433 family)
MIPNSPTLSVPLHTDEHGSIRVSRTRVTLDSIINFYLQGESPEQLHDAFPTVPLTDVYAVIAYYLAHQQEVDAYLKRREEEANRIRAEIEAKYPPITRDELEKRLEARKQDQDS